MPYVFFLNYAQKYEYLLKTQINGWLFVSLLYLCVEYKDIITK